MLIFLSKYIMSKIRNLFKKLTIKKQKPQEIDDEEIDFDEDISGEQTVIINTNDISDELVPHTTSNDSEIPPDSELVFPKVPESETPEDINNQTPPLDSLELDDELDNATETNSNITSEIDASPIINETLQDFEESEEAEFEAEEYSDDEVLEEPPQELTVNSLSEDNNDLEEESEPLEELEAQEKVVDEELEEEYYEDNQDSSFTKTDTIDLNQTGVGLKDKLDHVKTRFVDRFRNLNKKDLNTAFKKPDSKSKKISFDKIKSSAVKINWANIPSNFFNKANRNQFHKAFQISFILLTVFTAASLISVYINGSKDYKSLAKRMNIDFDDSQNFTRTELSEIKAANVFRTNKVEKAQNTSKPKINTDKVCKTATRKYRASSSIKVVSTIVLQDSVKSIASVQIRSSSELLSVREGQTLLGKVKVGKIDRLKLIVKNLSTGDCEYIESDSQKRSRKRIAQPTVLSPSKSRQRTKSLKKIKGIENDGDNFKIERSFLKNKLSDINSILTQARGIPIHNPDGTISFKIVDIEPSGLFAYLGMENNDVISQINGEPIKELNEVMNLFANVSNLSSLNLTIKRNGEDKTQNYKIK